MWVAFSETLLQMIRILSLILIGFLLNKAKLLPKETEAVLSKLMTLIFIPCLTFHTFMTQCTPENLVKYLPWVLYGGIFLAITIASAYFFAAKMSPDDSYAAGILRYCLSFPNTGAVGTPIVLAFFGTQGYFQYRMLNILPVIATYAWGIKQLIPEDAQKTRSPKQLLKKIFDPVFSSMMLGAILGLLGVAKYLPEIIPNTIQDLGNCYTLISLIIVGFAIAEFPLKEIFKNKLNYQFSALRLLVYPIAYLVILKLFHAPVVLCQMMSLVYMCPCGMNPVIFPAAYNKDSRLGSGLILISVLFSMITVPFVYALS